MPFRSTYFAVLPDWVNQKFFPPCFPWPPIFCNCVAICATDFQLGSRFFSILFAPSPTNRRQYGNASRTRWAASKLATAAAAHSANHHRRQPWHNRPLKRQRWIFSTPYGNPANWNFLADVSSCDAEDWAFLLPEIPTTGKCKSGACWIRSRVREAYYILAATLLSALGTIVAFV